MKMVGLSQNIPYAGQKGLAKRAARSEAEASAQERRGTEIDLVTAAKSAYLDLHYRRLNVRNLQDQRGLFEQIITSSTGKLRSNQAGQDEVLASQADLWRLESSILSAQQQVEASERTLNSLRGMDPQTPVAELASPPTEQIPESADAWLSAAKEHYPPLQRLRQMAESYSLSSQSSRRMQWPMLGLSASYGIRSGFDLLPDGMEEKRDNMVNFGANLSLPIFSGRQQRTMARSMDAMQKSALAEADQLSRDIEAELLNLFSRAQRLQRSVEMYTDRIIPASEDAYQSAQAGYVNNRTSFVTLMTYALAVNRDRITANDLANELGRTLVEVTRYTTDAGEWDSGPQNER
jgi:outer membrane protein TolC